jgi:hypothetical protein
MSEGDRGTKFPEMSGPSTRASRPRRGSRRRNCTTWRLRRTRYWSPRRKVSWRTGEEAGRARDRQGHGTKLAKELVPLGNGHAFARWAKLVEDGVEPVEAVSGEFQGLLHRYQQPSPACACDESQCESPCCIFFSEAGGCLRRRVSGGQRAEDGVDGMQACAVRGGAATRLVWAARRKSST